MVCKSINIKGSLVTLEAPLIMGILNITPDSFYAGSRKQTAEEIERRIEAILEEGGDMIDIGGYSSRPGAADIPEKQERERLAFALGIINRRCPGAVVSVDTFRAGIARYCVEEFGVAMINDISGGELDASMFETVADLQVPYVMMHMRGTPQTMQQHTGYGHLTGDIRRYFAEKVDQLRQMGVNDIILDPGFGFSKTLEQNYTLLRHLEDFEMFGLPLLVGVSRKGMIYKALGGTPEDSLNGTTALHTMALLNGADILRVHDVREAVEVAGLVAEYKKG